MIYSAETATALDPWLAKGFHDVPFETYCAMDAANSHGLMDIREKSPAYYQWHKTNRKVTKSMDFGTFAHMIILEPGVLETKMRLRKKVDGRTKAGQAYNAEFEASLQPGQLSVEEGTYETLKMLRDKLEKHPWISRILGKGKNETTGFWVHNSTQAFCKARLDKVLETEGWVVDVKTCADASPRAFQKQMCNLDYDLQCAFYWDAFSYQLKRKPEGYLFLCVENTGMHDVAIYTPEQTVVEHGRFKYSKALMEYADCVKTGVWPGYPQKAMPLELPGWAVYQEQEA